MIYVKVPKLADLLIITPPKIASVTATVEKRVHPRFIQSSASEFIELFVGLFPSKVQKSGRDCKGRSLFADFLGGTLLDPKIWRLRITFPRKNMMKNRDCCLFGEGIPQWFSCFRFFLDAFIQMVQCMGSATPFFCPGKWHEHSYLKLLHLVTVHFPALN